VRTGKESSPVRPSSVLYRALTVSVTRSTPPDDAGRTAETVPSATVRAQARYRGLPKRTPGPLLSPGALSAAEPPPASPPETPACGASQPTETTSAAAAAAARAPRAAFSGRRGRRPAGGVTAACPAGAAPASPASASPITTSCSRSAATSAAAAPCSSRTDGSRRAPGGGGSPRIAAIRASWPSGPAYPCMPCSPCPALSVFSLRPVLPGFQGFRGFRGFPVFPVLPLFSAVMSHHLVLVQAGAQRADRGVQPALDRALRDAELFGDGADRQIRVEAQDDDLALGVRQLVQTAGDGEGEQAGLLAGRQLGRMQCG